MSSNAPFEVQIPCDNDGYVLMQCPKCGSIFKLRPSDIYDDSVLQIWCPACGMISDSYFTDDVIDFAMVLAKNHLMDMLHEEMKNLERHTRGGSVSFKAGPKPKEDLPKPLMPAVAALIEVECDQCHKASKVQPLLALSKYNCPFCGVGGFNDD